MGSGNRRGQSGQGHRKDVAKLGVGCGKAGVAKNVSGLQRGLGRHQWGRHRGAASEPSRSDTADTETSSAAVSVRRGLGAVTSGRGAVTSGLGAVRKRRNSDDPVGKSSSSDAESDLSGPRLMQQRKHFRRTSWMKSSSDCRTLQNRSSKDQCKRWKDSCNSSTIWGS